MADNFMESDDSDALSSAPPLDEQEERKQELFGNGNLVADDEDDVDDPADEDLSEEAEESLVVDIDVPREGRLEVTHENMFIGNLPNFLHVDPKAFDEQEYDEEQDVEMDDEQQERRIKLKAGNTIRWRFKDESKLKDLNAEKESNARFVQWSDGSMSLRVGNEMFDITSKDLSTENQFIYLLHPSQGLLQAETKLDTGIAFRPFSTSSMAHKKLTATVLARHKKVNKTKFIGSVGNPEAAKLEMERMENEKIRNRKKLDSKRRNTSGMGGGFGLTASDLDDDDDEIMAMRNSRNAAGGRGAQTAGGDTYDDDYDDDFVVDDDHVEYDQEEDELDIGLRSSQSQPGHNKKALERGDGVVYQNDMDEDDDEDEDDEEEDGGNVKSASSKRRRMVMADEDD